MTRFWRRHWRRALVPATLLGVAVGAAVGVFAAAYPALWRPLGLARVSQLVAVEETLRGHEMQVAAPDLRDLLQTHDFTAAAVYRYWDVTVQPAGGLARSAPGLRASEDFAAVAGLRFAAGGWFNGAPAAGAEPVVLSFALWRRLGGQGARRGPGWLRLGGRRHQVVGVLAKGEQFPVRFPAQLAVPLSLTPTAQARRGAFSLHAFARLRHGVSAEAASRDAAAVAAGIRRRHPGTNAGVGVTVVPMARYLRRSGQPLRAVFWLSLLLLAAAAFSASGLELADMATRRRRAAIQAALGAGQRQALRDLAAEAAALCLMAVPLGLATGLAFARLGAAPGTGPPGTPWIAELLFAVCMAAAAVFLAVAAPAWLAFRHRDPAQLVRSPSGPAGTGAAGAQAWLSGTQAAVAVLAITATALLAASVVRLTSQPLGFDPANLLTVDLPLPAAQYPSAASWRAAYVQIRSRVLGEPTVVGAALAAPPPWEGVIGEMARPTGGRPRPVAAVRCGPDYFSVLGLRFLAGRPFGPGSSGRGEAVVSAIAARQLFGGADPLGRTVQVSDFGNLRVVGVASDFRQSEYGVPPAATIFLPLGAYPVAAAGLLVRIAKNAAPAVLPIRWAIARAAPVVPSDDIGTMRAAMAASQASRFLLLRVLAIFAALVLSLAIAGVAGMARRTAALQAREFAVRAAVGASPARILWLVLRRCAWPVLAGVAAGLLAAAELMPFLKTQLWHTGPHWLIAYLLAGVLVILAAAAAAAGPARRAASAAPADALRAE